MSIRSLFIVLFLSVTQLGVAQLDTIDQRIVLIGDAGQLTGGRHPVVDAVRSLIKLDKKTTVLFLGDNLYRNGLPDDQSSGYNEARAVLDSQLAVADGTDAKVYMIPGNHDWQNGQPGGYDAIIRQQLYVDFLGKKNIKYYPEDGCPGPVELDLGNNVVVILFDSQWWMHPHDKPGIESDCSYKTKEQLVAQIADIAARNSKKLIILACHHPFKSNGVHGGLFTLKQHIFPFTDIFQNAYVPLPVLGSIYPISRSVFGVPQDMKHPDYSDMIDKVSTAIKAVAPNIIFVSGHEHNLQHIRDSNYQYIISGGGCKDQRVSKSKRSLFTSPSMGFCVLEVSKNKIVTVNFYTATDSVRNPYTATLMDFSKLPSQFLDDSTKVEEDPFTKYKDTVSRAANPKMGEVKGLTKIFMGENYRKEWRTPVNMRVLNLRKERGGMTVVSLGGDPQSTSLRLKDSKGKEWTLRALNKNLTKTLPQAFQGSIVKPTITEFNSASFPYASLITPGLLTALGLQTPHPQLFYVPDDPAFGFYRKLFADKVCTLEEREPSADGSNTVSTAKMFGKMIDENDHRPEQELALKARLLDMVVGDFDRHFDQWKWSISDTGKGKLYTAIPKGRDMAFFNAEGLQMKLFTGRALPFLKGFHNRLHDVDWLGYGARDFDRLFLNDLDAKEWEETIASVQQKLNDSAISRAVHQLPPEIFSAHGETIIQKIGSRRNQLSKDGMTYYKFISRKVNIVGSNDREYFKVSSVPAGLEVKVYARSRINDTGFILYNRVFDRLVTKEIRLFGLNGNDLFYIDTNATSTIKIRVIGGKGSDTFDMRGHVESMLYDIKSDDNHILHNSRTKNRFSINPPVNDNSITGFQYDRIKYPRIYLGGSSDMGFVAGAGVSKRTHGFRNLPFASDQRLAILYYFEKAWQFYYKGEFNHITRNLDVLLNINSQNPGLQNFFGLGNRTVVDKSKGYRYYLAKYKTFEVEALFRRRVFETVHLMGGPYYYQYSARPGKNLGQVLSDPRSVGLDPSTVFSTKKYFGAKGLVHIDNRNSEVFPTRGIHWDNELLYAAGMGNGSHSLLRFTSDMTLYISQNDPKLIAVLKLGTGRIYSKQFEFFQALALGNNNLLGFRQNRFLGSSMTYGSLELRMKIFDLNAYTLSGPVGITGFFDMGKVKLRGESSKKIHSAFGGGFYFIPFNLFLITATAGFSGSDKSLNFSIGSKISLRY
ncbi:MAG TPA: metallophosphoesterase [Chitinophagaceae bacterium]|nr:metallophosphoesterase [Chitinophagaceae bacterium]